MTHIYRILAFAVLLAASGSARSDDEKDKAKAEELKKLQGTWKVVSAEFAGKAMTPKEIAVDRIVVAGEKMTLKNGDKDTAVYGFELQPDRKPKVLVWKKEMKEGTGLLPVIYEIDGTKLKLCFPLLPTEPSKEAPKPPESFDTKDKPLGLIVAEREKDKQ